MAGCGSPIHLKPGARLSFRCRSRPVRNTPSRNATCWGKLSLLLLRRSSKLPISVKGLPPRARLLSVPGVNPRRSRSSKGRVRLPLRHLGRHGARLATAEGFGAIMLDIRMPVLDGLAAARHIRAAEPEGHRTPLFALTANAFASDKRAAIEAGIDYFIAKPVDP